MAIAIIIASVAFLALDMTTPHAQAASSPNCVSTIPSPVPGTPAPAPTAPGTLFINEVLTNPNTPWNCADQSYTSKDAWSKDAWIELYNTQNQPVDLSSSHAEINIGTTEYAYILPFPSIIASHGFLVVFPLIGSDISTIPSAQLKIGGTIIDSISVPTLLPDQSYARITDGGSWQVSNYPTIGASNRLDPPPPTPTPTKTPKIRVTKTKTPKAKRSSSSNQSNTAANPTNSSTDDSLTNDGIQPSWHTLQFPGGTASPSPALATVTPSSTAPQQSVDPSDVPKKIIISASVVVLAFALLWCWKHFLSP
jgi:hypothetical protein